MASIRTAFIIAAAGFCLAAAPPQADRPILILISLDGWRWDYLDRAEAPNLRKLAASGVRAEGLIPAFPSKTFPNHYTLVTGLSPEHHGIVSNAMVDRTIGPERFTMTSATAKDARWWGGEPMWVTAIRQGRREFLTQFPSVRNYIAARSLDDPASRHTFERCKLDFSERETNRGTYLLHQSLLRLRRDLPAFSAQFEGLDSVP